MKSLLLATALILASATSAQARTCNPEKSKPCGNGCISKSFTCHKTSTSSVSGTGTKAPATKPATAKAPAKK